MAILGCVRYFSVTIRGLLGFTSSRQLGILRGFLVPPLSECPPGVCPELSGLKLSIDSSS
jgi:hypothetical protein